MKRITIILIVFLGSCRGGLMKSQCVDRINNRIAKLEIKNAIDSVINSSKDLDQYKIKHYICKSDSILEVEVITPLDNKIFTFNKSFELLMVTNHLEKVY